MLDTYQLKSMDGIIEGHLKDIRFVKDGNKIRVVQKTLQSDNFALRDSYDKVVRCLGFTFDYSVFNK